MAVAILSLLMLLCSCVVPVLGRSPSPQGSTTSCSSTPCLNGGRCSSTLAGYFCTCTERYTGKNCEKENPCYPNPCKNGGSCRAYGTSIRCRCTAGFRGDRCQSKYCPFSTCKLKHSRFSESSVEECIKNKGNEISEYESCHKMRAKAMVESLNCDCNKNDYSRTKRPASSYRTYKFQKCLTPGSVQKMNCNNYTRHCALKIVRAPPVVIPFCSEEMKSYKREVEQCIDIYNKGCMNFDGCESLKEAYETVKYNIDMILKASCTGCNVRGVQISCMKFRGPMVGLCREVADFPRFRKCVKESLDTKCPNAMEAVLNYMDSEEYGSNEKSSHICDEISNYEKIWKRWGCGAEVDLTTWGPSTGNIPGSTRKTGPAFSSQQQVRLG